MEKLSGMEKVLNRSDRFSAPLVSIDRTVPTTAEWPE
jgi:hypothetical protein